MTVFTPAQIRHAYGFDQVLFGSDGRSVAADGSGQTIAIVAAYDNPTISADLKAFSAQWNLPDPIFTKSTPHGQPAVNSGWAGEIALDVEWAHAIAPGAKIQLVEAASASITDLLSAVDYARQQPGVSTVSMSWGGTEFPGETTFDTIFTSLPGHNVTFVASSGDNGPLSGVSYPAASPNVISVGGTSLNTSGPTGSHQSETSWIGSGGGISSYESQPAYQSRVQSTGARTVPDVAYNADPNTGVYVLDSSNGGWFTVGGTSAGAPQWAGLVAIANQGRALAGNAPLDGASQTLPTLYMTGTTSLGSAFQTVTSSLSGAPSGYNTSTGLGSPVANKIVTALVNATGLGAPTNITATVKSVNSGTATKHDVPDPSSGISAEVVMAIMAGSRTTSVTAPPVTPATTSFRVNVLQNLEVVLTGQQQQIAKFGSQRIESGGGDNSLFEYEETFLDDFPVEKGPPARQEKAQPPTGEASTLEALYSPAPLKAACDSCFADQSWLLATAETPAAKASEQESSAGMTPLAAAGGLFLLLGNVWQAPATRERTESRRKPAMA